MTLEPPTATSEQTAEEGCVLVRGAHRDYILSDAVAWREGETYIIRSSEFDVMAEDEDFGEAVDVFVCRLLDYTSMLHDLVQNNQATPDEATAFTELAGRFFPLDTHRKRPSIAAMNDLADRLRVPRDEIDSVLADWTSDRLRAHLSGLTKDELRSRAPVSRDQPEAE